ncbi:putative GIY-YIG superfamily endonuclease [Elusimicrobium simillimum]|uniref:GIY-YIG nuclease family protein n=1 Tax=Elusimicrobium simillimum TaxID=3143438 RepID=UPI003C6F0694
MKYVYILESINFKETYYIGITSDLKKRFKEHNLKNGNHSEKFQPWKLKCYFAFDNPEKANAFEKYLKTSSGRSFCKRHF